MSIRLQPIQTTSVRAFSVEEEHGLPSPVPSPVPSDDGKAHRDLENRSPQDSPVDPYMLRSAVKSTSEIQELRRRGKTWKGVGAYHEKQNLVGWTIIAPFI